MALLNISKNHDNSYRVVLRECPGGTFGVLKPAPPALKSNEWVFLAGHICFTRALDYNVWGELALVMSELPKPYTEKDEQ